MISKAKTLHYKLAAAMTAGAFAASTGEAFAQAKNFSTISTNITNSISNLPGLLSALAYLFGIILAIIGILKIKDHVENPSQTKIQEGAIRLAAGGALFALPLISEAMLSTIGDGKAVDVAKLNKVKIGLAD